MPDRTVLMVGDFNDTRTMIRMLPEMKVCRVPEAVNWRRPTGADH